MSGPRFVSLEEAAATIRDGETLGVGGMLLTRLPIALVAGIARARRRNLGYVGWGGGLPLELLLAAGAVSRLTFCFSSLDVFGPAPRFRAALEGGSLDVDERTALSFIQGLEAAGQRLPSFPLQPPRGSDMLSMSPGTRTGLEPVQQKQLAFGAAVPLDAALLHCQRADTDGNLEISGARGLDVILAAAASRVVATVEEVVPAGRLGRVGQAHVIPRHLVAAIVHEPRGAHPSGCLPYYVADLQALQTSANGEASRSIDAERARLLSNGARVTVDSVRDALDVRSDDAAATVDELMVCWLAGNYDDASVCSAGAVSPLAMTSYLLAKATHAPELTIFTTGGCYLDVAMRPMLLALAEPLDAASARVHCGGEDSYHLYYQQGRVTHEVVSAAQIDATGATNNVVVTSPSGQRVRLPGQGGMADVANLHRNFLMYATRHSALTLVERVEHRSAARALLTPAERSGAGLSPGTVQLVTNLCVFRVDEGTRRFRLVSLHPGVTLEQVEAATGFGFEHEPKPPTTPAPSPEQLRVLRTRVDPLGIRRLEFQPARERGALLAGIIGAEERVMAAVEDLIPPR